MALRLRDLWDWRGTTSRRDYAVWGVLLFALKYNLDRLIALKAFGLPWYPWTYLFGTAPYKDVPTWSDPRAHWLFITLVLQSLPFIWAGVVLTLRRLRDAGWPLPLVVLFFVPFINLLFFFLLCVQPARQPPTPEEARRTWLGRIVRTDNIFIAATLGIVASAALGAGLTAFGTMFLKTYGLGLFMGTPFMMGLTSVLFYAAARPRAWFECLGVAILSVGVLGGLVLVLAIEGFICVLMALPIGGLLAMLGAGVGYWIQIGHWARRLDGMRVYAVAWVVLPLLLTAESRLPAGAPLIAVTTTCEIAAPPETVWRNVVAFSELPPPVERIFLAGIAYPVRARLEGRGVGAVRHCEFSTGPFVEPITTWDENRRLAFDVIAQPHPLREWSPYAGLEPAHLEGFFRSKRGQFLLIPLDDGRRTRLEGTTWYEQEIWPGTYWRLWSDYLVHTIHHRVLNHIKAEAEQTSP